MKNIFTIAWREYKSYFITPVAYVYLVAFLAITSWVFFRGFFLVGQADMRTFFQLLPWIFLFFVPAVSMGKWSEEKKQGTFEILMTLPIRDEYFVLGKFLAAWGLIGTALLFTMTLPGTVSLIGNLDWGPVFGGYIGAMLLGGSFLAIGLFVSSLTENQIVSFIISLVACFILYVIGTPLFGGASPGLFTKSLQQLGLASHFMSISRGVLDSKDIVYYVSFIFAFLYFNWMVIRGRR